MASGLVCGVGLAHATLKTGGGGKHSASGQGRPTYYIISEATMHYRTWNKPAWYLQLQKMVQITLT